MCDCVCVCVEGVCVLYHDHHHHILNSHRSPVHSWLMMRGCFTGVWASGSSWSLQPGAIFFTKMRYRNPHESRPSPTLMLSMMPIRHHISNKLSTQALTFSKTKWKNKTQHNRIKTIIASIEETKFKSTPLYHQCRHQDGQIYRYVCKFVYVCVCICACVAFVWWTNGFDGYGDENWPYSNPCITISLMDMNMTHSHVTHTCVHTSDMCVWSR